MFRILIVDDEPSIRYTFESFFTDAGYEVFTAKNYDEATDEISQRSFDAIFTDIVMGGKTGIDLLRIVKEKQIICPVVMITGYPNIETASEAVRLGAFDYIEKPVHKEVLLNTAKKALEHKKILDENKKYRSHIEAILESVKDGIITVDNKLNIIKMNEAAVKIFGLSQSSSEISFESLVNEKEEQELFRELRNTLYENKSVELYRREYNLNNKSGVFTININPLIKDKSDFSGALMVIRDETPLVELEKTLKKRRSFHNIIGRNEKMQKVYALIEKLSPVPTTVLITGESGTGKELIAEALHYKSPRKNESFVKVNCSALPENLLESELFGHVKGAFTGAIKTREGRFQKADGGTIFLDEIGDITPALQLRLLRVLQEKEFEPVGGTDVIKVDVRIISATNQNLKEKVRDGSFREDLYYRLKVVEIHLPSLKERKEDIILLTDYFIERLNKEFNKNIKSVSKDVQRLFLTYEWPGNIRELENAIEHAVILADHSIITIEDLPLEIRDFNSGSIKKSSGNSKLNNEEKIIRDALEKCNWKKARAARLLGLSRKTIHRKVKKYDIKKEE